MTPKGRPDRALSLATAAPKETHVRSRALRSFGRSGGPPQPWRSQVIGTIAHRELTRGELKAELRRLSHERYRPPDADLTRTFSLPTLERWLYRYRHGGLDALRPRRLCDRGRAKNLTAEQRTLLLDIRREHPGASVALILRTLVADGRLAERAVSPATVRRLYHEQGPDLP